MKKILFNILLLASIFFFTNAYSQISSAQTINFDTADDTNLGPVANDGEGGSTAITGVQINIIAINAAGTATGVDLIYNVTDVGFGAKIEEGISIGTDPATAAWRGISIKSNDGSEFDFNGFESWEFSFTGAVTLNARGYKNGVATGTGATVITTADGDRKVHDSSDFPDADFGDVDEVRIIATTDYYGTFDVFLFGARTSSGGGTAPTVATVAPTTVTSSEADLGGNVTNIGGSAVTERGVVYALTATNANPEIGGTGVTKVAIGSGSGGYVQNITGLTASSGYSFKAYATNSSGTSYGSVDTFTTTGGGGTAPTVATVAPTTVTDSEADLGGNVTNIGDSPVTERGVVYSLTATNADPIIDGTGVTKVVIGSGSGGYVQNITGLTSGSGYSFKAYATNTDGTSYGSVDAFTTTGVEGGGTTPIVATVAPIEVNITATSAGLGGNVTNIGGSAVTERGVVYALTATNSNPEIDGIGATKVAIGSGFGAYEQEVTGLTSDSGYSFKAYATNTSGTSYGSVETFTTTGVSNSAPVVTAPSAPSVNEDDANVALANNVAVTDSNAADTQTLTIVITGGTVTLGTTGITFGGSGNGTSNFTAQGNITNINTALDAATFTPTANLNGTNVASISIASNDGTADSNTASVTFSIAEVNDEPSFTKGANQTVNEDVGLQTVNTWATDLNKGNANEIGQTLIFTLTNDNNSLFSTQPALSTNGTLTYTPAEHANGSATVSVVLKDNGGTTNGGDDTFATQSFTITVTAVNDPPSFTLGADQIVNEDASAQTLGFATDIAAGPADESGQTLVFTVSNNNASLFSTQPSINASGVLSYTPAANENGTTTVTVILQDSGGTANGGSDTTTKAFTISITAVNDPPSFTKGADQTIDKNLGAQTVTNWATNLSKGPANESSQTLTFTVTNNNNSLFSTQPAIDALGNLTYTPANDATGSATVSVVLKDNGGGATDTFTTQTFTITVNETTPIISSFNDVTYAYGSDNITLNATSNSGGTITYSIEGSNTTGTTLSGINNATVTLGNVGTVTIRATVAANGSYTSGTKDITLTIEKATQTVTFVDGASVEKPLGTAPYTLTATATSGGAVTFSSSEPNVATISGNTITLVAIGTTTITATQAGNANYGTASGTQVLQIVAGLPTVSTAAAGTVTQTSAILNGEVTSGNGASIIERGFVYNISGDAEVFTVNLSGATGVFNTELNGLSPNTNYSYKAYAKNATGISYGDVKTFTTLSLPTIAFSQTISSGLESVSSADIPVTLSAASTTSVTVNYAVTGTATGNGTDYTLANGTLTFNTGETTKNITIASIVDDAIFEADETVIITISSPTNATLGANTVHTYTITNNDTAILTVDDVIGSENGNITFTVTFTGTTEAGFSIDYQTVAGTATGGTDFTTSSGTLNFSGTNGETKQFSIDVIDDSILETDETFTVAFSGLNPSTPAITLPSSATGTIKDNDFATVTIADVSGNEDDGAITLTATLDKEIPGGFTVDVNTADGTATLIDNDYSEIISHTLTFTGTAGETKTFTLTPTVDDKPEADETLTVSMNNLTGTSLSVHITNTATVTIKKDEILTANDDTINFREDDSAKTVLITGNDIGNNITISAIDNTGTIGSVSLNTGTGIVSYNPNGAFESLAVGATVTDTFTYMISDGYNTAIAKVTVTITGENDVPDATDDSAVTDTDLTFGEDDGVRTITADIVGNDTDRDSGDVLTVSEINTSGTKGMVTLVGGIISYNPNGAFESLAAGKTATDTFTYTLSDGNGATDTATVTITINGVNDAPKITSSPVLTVNAGETYTYPITTEDADGDDITVTLTAPTQPSWLRVSGGVAGEVTTLAGSGNLGNTDGTGTAASFNYPYGVMVDGAGNVYVADTFNHKIRKITPTGEVTTLAGSGSSGSTDGAGTVASFDTPTGVAVDGKGNVYVADRYNNKIRKITPTGEVTTLAGSGSFGSTDGTGTAASFYYPTGVTVDGTGTIYVADTNNNKIRKITPTGEVTTLAGSGNFGSTDGTGTVASFNYPYGVTVDGTGTIYVADTNNNKIRKITPTGEVTTLAGSGNFGSTDGTGTVASFNYPYGVTVDGKGNVYVADRYNHKIRKITPTGEVTTLAGSGSSGSTDGTGTAASFNYPYGVTVDGTGTIYVAGGNNHKIRKISSGKVVLTGTAPNEAGTHNVTLTADDGNSGTATQTFAITVRAKPSATSNAADVITASGATLNGEATADATTPITKIGFVYSVTSENADPIIDGDKVVNKELTTTTSPFLLAITGLKGRTKYSFKAYAINEAGISYGDVKTFTTLNTPPTFTSTPILTVNEGETYTYPITTEDADGDEVKVTATTKPSWLTVSGGKAGEVTTLAGSSDGFANGTGTAAKFNYPTGVAVDGSGNVYVADSGNNRIRKITPAGVVTTLAGSGNTGSRDGMGTAASFYAPHGVAVDGLGNVYVADAGSHKIRKITPNGVVSTMAGSTSGFADGTGIDAEFDSPFGVAVDGSGNVYVADYYNNRIRKITSQGVVTTLAGSTTSGFANGTGTAAKFNLPHGVEVDASGNVYVADFYNHKIRKITPAGVVSTLAGSIEGFADGTGTAAKFERPTRVAVDGSGNVYVADNYNDKIRKITPAGVVSTLKVSIIAPNGVAVDDSGNVYVSSGASNKIYKISGGTVLTGTAPNEAGTHNVTLTADDKNGGTTKQTFTITVKGKPIVTVSDATAITDTNATIHGEVTEQGGGAITERGFIYAKTSDNTAPTLTDVDGTTVFKVVETGTIGIITKKIESLTANTAYNFVAFATNSIGTRYSTVKAFNTKKKWDNVGDGAASAGAATYQSLVLSSDGTPYIAYQDAANGKKVTVRKFVNNAWEVVGTAGFSVDEASYLSLALNSKDIPYVAYRDGGNSNGTTVMKLNNNTWELVGNAGFSGSSSFLSLAFYTDDKPLLAYQDGSDSNKTYLASFNGGQWGTSPDATSNGGASYQNLAIDTDNNAFVVYKDATISNKTSVMKYNKVRWDVVGPFGFSAGEANYQKIAIDANKTPYVVYQDVANSNKTTVMKFVNNAWEVVGSAGFSDGAAIYQTIAIANDGTLYVAYSDASNDDKAVVKKFDSVKDKWVTVGTDGLAKGTSNQNGWVTLGKASNTPGAASYVSLAIDKSGAPFVAFSDAGSGNKATVKKFIVLVPAVATESVGEITDNTALLKGVVSSDNGAVITERGIIYSLTATNSDPTIDGTGVTKESIGSGTGAFSTTITSLEANTEYSFKAYAINSKGLSYGIKKSFKTTATVLSVEDLIFKELKVYPNPVSNVLYIKGQVRIEKITISNLLGQKVFERKNDSNNVEIDFSNLKSGLYFVKVQAENKSKVYKVFKSK